MRLLASARARSAPTCRGRAGARSRAAPDRRPRPSRRARRRACPLAWPAPGWTTSPAGLSTTSRCSSSQTIARLRRAAATAPARAPSATLDLLAAREPVALRRARRRRRARPPRPPARPPRASRAASARKRSSRSPAASAARHLHRAATSSVRRGGRGLRSAATSAAEQDRDADHDEAVGEVERRPPAEVDEVGHVAQPDPVDEVREAAADQQAERGGQHRMARAGAGEEDDHPDDRGRGDERDDRRRAGEEPERDAGVLDVVDRERPDDVHRLVERERARDDVLRHLVGDHRGDARPSRGPPTATAPAASERSATESGVSPSVDEPTRTSRSLLRLAQPARRWSSMQSRAHGSARSRSSPIGLPQTSQVPYVPVVDPRERRVDLVERLLRALLEPLVELAVVRRRRRVAEMVVGAAARRSRRARPRGCRVSGAGARRLREPRALLLEERPELVGLDGAHPREGYPQAKSRPAQGPSTSASSAAGGSGGGNGLSLSSSRRLGSGAGSRAASSPARRPRSAPSAAGTRGCPRASASARRAGACLVGVGSTSCGSPDSSTIPSADRSSVSTRRASANRRSRSAERGARDRARLVVRLGDDQLGLAPRQLLRVGRRLLGRDERVREQLLALLELGELLLGAPRACRSSSPRSRQTSSKLSATSSSSGSSRRAGSRTARGRSARASVRPVCTASRLLSFLVEPLEHGDEDPVERRSGR